MSDQPQPDTGAKHDVLDRAWVTLIKGAILSFGATWLALIFGWNEVATGTFIVAVLDSLGVLVCSVAIFWRVLND